MSDRLLFIGLAHLIRGATCVLLLAACAMPAQTKANAHSAYVFVVEDDDSLKQTGNASDRAMYAQAAGRLRAGGIKSIAFKYFFFATQDAAVDATLAQQMYATPTLLQYELKGEYEKTEAPSVVDDTMLEKMRAAADRVDTSHLLAGEHTHLPIQLFARAATRLGFVDVVAPFAADLIPLLGHYGHYPVKSIMLELIEEQYGAATATANGVRVGTVNLKTDAKGRYRCDGNDAPAPNAITLRELLTSRQRRDLRGKTAIFIYEGDHSPTIATGFAKYEKIHTLFARQLACIEDALQRDRQAQ